jgi:hypothetical protein
MSRTKSKPREQINKQFFTYEDVSALIFSVPIPPQWRKGQFVFNRASALYGDPIARAIGHDPFYNDKNIKPFINALVEALNKSN